MSAISLIQKDIARINASDDVEQLKDELASCLTMTLEHILKMAAIVRRLDDLGVQVSIDNAMLPYIRLIGHGQMSAGLLVAFAGDTNLLEKARQLPLPIQESIARNEPVKVMEIGGDHRMVPPLELTARERRLVFAGKKIRSDSEQIGFLKELAEKDRSKQLQTGGEPAVRVDKKRCGIIANGLFIPVSELAGYVASLSR